MSHTLASPTLAARWKHWGAGFSTPPCPCPVELE